MKPLVFLLFVLLVASAFGQTGTHQVQLTWIQSTSAGVTSNNVYRSSTSGSGYALVYASSTPITSFTDVSLLAGTYYFVVTALIGTTESGYSGQAKAVVVDVVAPGTPTVTQIK